MNQTEKRIYLIRELLKEPDLVSQRVNDPHRQQRPRALSPAHSFCGNLRIAK